MHLSLPGVCIIFLCGWFPIVVGAQGNTTCKTTSLDWYTSFVGETPCQTYQQLRQICNTAYTVGSLILSSYTIPDSCNDLVAGCCCNSVSFSLMMLCLNCQQGVGTGIGNDTGIDANKGVYQQYLGNCTPNYNQGLPNDVQLAVCNNKIKIDNDLYQLFWTAGDWFYMYTRETMQKDQQTYANNTFTHCASTTISNTTTNSSSSSVTSASTVSVPKSSNTGSFSSATKLSAGSIAGITVGVVAAVLLLIGLLFRFLRKRRVDDLWADNVVSSADQLPDMDQAAYEIDPFISPGAATTISPAPNNHFHVSTERSEVGYSSSSQALATVASGSLHSSGRPEKGRPSSILEPSSSDPSLEWHADDVPLLGRSSSGRPPPAYGEIREDV